MKEGIKRKIQEGIEKGNNRELKTILKGKKSVSITPWLK